MSVHLLVITHGMWGNPAHIAEMTRIIQETKGSADAEASAGGIELNVLMAQANRDESTYDGVDWQGERVANEVDTRVQELEREGKKVTKLSVAGYSLGGLVARYLVGILLQRDFFTKVQPVNFATFATPHIGLVRYRTTFSRLQHMLGPRLLSRTGEQFFARDKWGITEKSLLEVMADPKEIFYQALTKFEHIHIYGNAVNDLTVPYVSALFEVNDPFANRAKTGMEVEFDPKYNPIILSYRIPDVPPVVKPIKPFSGEWFAKLKPTRFLPPFLANLSFPLNYIAAVLLPVLFPTIFVLVLCRFLLHTRSSRARIRMLERDMRGRDEPTLLDAFARLEREIEGAVVEIAEDDFGADEERTVVGMVTPSASDERDLKKADVSGNGHSNGTGSAQDDETNGHAATNGSVALSSTKQARTSPASLGGDHADASAPQLSAAQRRMAGALNALPRLAKHLVYLDPMRNSHATIVARDVRGFAFHKRGWGVLQHWADGFVL